MEGRGGRGEWREGKEAEPYVNIRKKERVCKVARIMRYYVSVNAFFIRFLYVGDRKRKE